MGHRAPVASSKPHRPPRGPGIIVMPVSRLPTRLEVLTQRYADEKLTWWEFEDAVGRALADGTLDQPEPLVPPRGLPPAPEGIPLERELR